MARKFRRIFFATDLHGSDVCFRKFIAAGDFYGADTLILGGDMTGKMIVRIVEKKNGKYVCNYWGRDWEFDSPKDLSVFEQRVRNAGYYPYRTSESETDDLTSDSSKLDKLFAKLMMERLESWVSFAEEKLKNRNVQCYITGGNDDPFEVSEILRKSKVIVDPEEKVVRLDESHEMISLGYSNPTPWNLPRDVPEERLAEMIYGMTSKVETMSNCIFNLHVPPKDSLLDQCPLLDASVEPPKPVTKGGQPVVFGAGSKAVADAIRECQPLLGLHGHIHESRAAQEVGRTICLNPGSEYSEGILRGAIISYDEKRILSHQFTSG